MALSLTAEQKSIIEIFSGEDRYIIPPFQRQYSWTEEQCTELFEDIKNAFYKKDDNGYFLGNIVVAKSNTERNRLEVIDGQQRLITLTLLIKVLLSLDTSNSALRNAIWIKVRRTDKKVQRLVTNVFEEKDSKYLEEVLSLDITEEICNSINRRDNKFKKNICYFYKELKQFEKNNDIQDFSDFLIDSVYLLPIQSEDNDKDKAREKALIIFETINDRGLNLSDSDIFKAKLYTMSLNDLKQDDFINTWTELDIECNLIAYSIDEIFRIYTHIIRGNEGIKSPEIGLREFFIKTDYSPFNKKKCNEILDDLSHIIASIKFYKDVIEKPNKYSELAKWFQLINQYTNQYPSTVLIVYLYHTKLVNNEALLCFSKNLVRYVYYQGSTTRIKFYIYGIIIKILHDKEIQYPIENVEIKDFKSFGRLKNAFALLVFYISNEQTAIYPYYFDKIISFKDKNKLDKSWDGKDYYEYVDTIGNLLLIDLPKRSTTINKKIVYLEQSGIISIKKLAKKFNTWTYDEYTKREKHLSQMLLEFFRNEN